MTHKCICVQTSDCVYVNNPKSKTHMVLDIRNVYWDSTCHLKNMITEFVSLQNTQHYRTQKEIEESSATPDNKSYHHIFSPATIYIGRSKKLRSSDAYEVWIFLLNISILNHWQFIKHMSSHVIVITNIFETCASQVSFTTFPQPEYQCMPM